MLSGDGTVSTANALTFAGQIRVAGGVQPALTHSGTGSLSLTNPANNLSLSTLNVQQRAATRLSDGIYTIRGDANIGQNSGDAATLSLQNNAAMKTTQLMLGAAASGNGAGALYMSGNADLQSYSNWNVGNVGYGYWSMAGGTATNGAGSTLYLGWSGTGSSISPAAR